MVNFIFESTSYPNVVIGHPATFLDVENNKPRWDNCIFRPKATTILIRGIGDHDGQELMITLGENMHRVFKGITGYRYCTFNQEHYFGFKGYLVSYERGIPLNFSVAPAYIDEREGRGFGHWR